MVNFVKKCIPKKNSEKITNLKRNFGIQGKNMKHFPGSYQWINTGFGQ